jgi:glycosyltransferase involved in cell wall biosynthesis
LIHRKKVTRLQILPYKLTFLFCKKYICYTPSVKESLAPFMNTDKLQVDYNTLTNDSPVPFQEKSGDESDIFFIGRLRPNCEVELLIEATDRVRNELNKDVQLHIIGDGEKSGFVKKTAERFGWVNYYGMIFDQSVIAEISRKCAFGCYPGDMGLSVVHMMSLSLPPLTHGEMHIHQGPEPSYIRDDTNGWLYFPRGSLDAVTQKMKAIYSLERSELKKVQRMAFETYLHLSDPPHHVRLASIINADDP